MESFTLSEVCSYYESEMDSPGESEIDPRVGVVFRPTNEETIQILEHKSSHRDYKFDAISEADIYKYEPYELPGLGAIESDGKFYFFCALNPLDANGGRFSRATGTGYWKKTGKKFPIIAKGTHEEIGSKRTLVFYKRFPGGYEERTNWVMHEYSANNNPQDFVVCKIKEKKEKRKKEKKEDKKRGSSTKYENKRRKKRLISSDDDEGQKSHYVTFDNENHMIEKSSLETQQLSSCHLISTSTHHDGSEIISPEQQLSPSCYLISNPTSDGIEDTSQVDTMPLEGLNSLNGSTVPHQTSPWIHSPILPEQGSSSSVSSNETDWLNSPFAIDWDFLSQFALAGQDEFLYPDFHPLLGEETGHTIYSSVATPTY